MIVPSFCYKSGLLDILEDYFFVLCPELTLYFSKVKGGLPSPTGKDGISANKVDGELSLELSS